jgi:hypothetical protein
MDCVLGGLPVYLSISVFMYEVLVHMRKTHARHFRTLPVTKGIPHYLIDNALQGGVVWVRIKHFGPAFQSYE